ncbi:hypothetical protein LY76DRAFT_589559, partial [Colletotrichum caudatum]
MPTYLTLLTQSLGIPYSLVARLPRLGAANRQTDLSDKDRCPSPPPRQALESRKRAPGGVVGWKEPCNFGSMPIRQEWTLVELGLVCLLKLPVPYLGKLLQYVRLGNYSPLHTPRQVLAGPSFFFYFYPPPIRIRIRIRHALGTSPQKKGGRHPISSVSNSRRVLRPSLPNLPRRCATQLQNLIKSFCRNLTRSLIPIPSSAALATAPTPLTTGLWFEEKKNRLLFVAVLLYATPPSPRTSLKSSSDGYRLPSETLLAQSLTGRCVRQATSALLGEKGYRCHHCW